MTKLKAEKITLLIAIAATTLLPVWFIPYDEPTAGLQAIKILAKIGSLVGAMLLVWQFLLGFRGAVGWLVPDLLWLIDLHKALGACAIPLILLHPIFITIYYARRFGLNVFSFEAGAAFAAYVALGVFALLLVAFIVVTSLFLRSRMDAHTWYRSHLLSYAIMPAVLVHGYAIGMTIAGTGMGVLWRVLIVLVSVFYLSRLLFRFGWAAHPHRVIRTVPVADQTTEITMRPLAAKMTPRIGQFVFLRRQSLAGARPYTVSHYDPDTGELAVTIKALGETSSRHQDIEPGERVLLDGPYGVFTWEALTTHRPIVMIAGGIGITPFRRLHRQLNPHSDRQHFLFYGNTDSRDIAYREELEQAGHVQVVHVISDEPDYPGEKGYITADLLEKYLGPELARCEFFICGPPAMTVKLERELHQRYVPTDQVHHELFTY
ncbi:MAG: hypothetical protein GXY33_00555 [Phycisphaerae bacterium]|nr:hypothetical protein [Phycisphaerae bacterium]